MTLEEAILEVLSADDSAVIFAKKPWVNGADSIISTLDDELKVPVKLKNQGFHYFLEYSLIDELNLIRAERTIDDAKFIQVVIFYAENDAYPEWIE